MATIVIGCGRSGTNVALAVLSGHPYFNLDPQIENKTIFTNVRKYDKKYLAKTDTHYARYYEQLKELMKVNTDMNLIWTIRDPRDMLMSKIRRGQPKKDGGDNNTNRLFDDATPQGAIDDMKHMLYMYDNCKDQFKVYCYLVKMEGVLLNPTHYANELCEFHDLPYVDTMADFPSRMPNAWKKKRYGNLIDKSQVCLWRRWKTAYNGFFVKNNYDMERWFEEVQPLVKYFNYD